MKKIKRVVLLFLLLSEIYPNDIIAQTRELKIGDSVPNLYLNKIINYKAGNANLWDFKGKLLILDFWATTCSPCVEMFERTDSLQKVFGDQVFFLPVTWQKEDKISEFSSRRFNINHKLLISVVEDSILKKAFYFQSIPHYVWINQQGVVLAMTSGVEITKANIGQYLSNKSLNVKTKKDSRKRIDLQSQVFHESYLTKSNTILDSQYLNDSSVYFHSVFTKYIEGANNGFIHFEQNRFTAINMAVSMLLKEFYAIKSGNENIMEFANQSKTLYNIKDSAKLYRITGGLLEALHDPNAWIEWMKINAFCYEFVAPPSTSNEKCYNWVENDIRRYFTDVYDIKFKIVDTTIFSYILKRTSNIDKIGTKSVLPEISRDRFSLTIRNKSVDDFISTLQYFFQNTQVNLVNETLYPGNIDISLNCSMKNIHDINSELKKYDLEFVRKNIRDKVLLIEDADN